MLVWGRVSTSCLIAARTIAFRDEGRGQRSAPPKESCIPRVWTADPHCTSLEVRMVSSGWLEGAGIGRCLASCAIAYGFGPGA